MDCQTVHLHQVWQCPAELPLSWVTSKAQRPPQRHSVHLKGLCCLLEEERPVQCQANDTKSACPSEVYMQWLASCFATNGLTGHITQCHQRAGCERRFLYRLQSIQNLHGNFLAGCDSRQAVATTVVVPAVSSEVRRAGCRTSTQALNTNEASHSTTVHLAADNHLRTVGPGLLN